MSECIVGRVHGYTGIVLMRNERPIYIYAPTTTLVGSWLAARPNLNSVVVCSSKAARRRCADLFAWKMRDRLLFWGKKSGCMDGSVSSVTGFPVCPPALGARVLTSLWVPHSFITQPRPNKEDSLNRTCSEHFKRWCLMSLYQQ